MLTRDHAAAAALRAAGIDSVVGDVRDPAARAAAVAGCETVVSAVHGFLGGRGAGPEAIDRDANASLIGAAAAAGIARFVLLSAYGASPTHPMILHRMKYAAEEVLLASDLRGTIVRPTAYLETWIDVIGARTPGRGAIVLGKGENPINFVSVDDVVTAILDAVRSAANNRMVDVIGPENLSFSEIAERLAARSTPPGAIAHVPLAMLRAMSLLAGPISPAFARRAKTAVVMNTEDMTVDVRRARPGATTIDDVLARRDADRVR
ncbi:hypothetical protein GCM10023171_13540 [Microbacterium panaciterrae]|uniref:NAD(P)-binding domain-containing protein n=1 Tax=Microbacterium panaciterrae TaxID=985759 RepID=A0ABP8PA15_9MICO